MSVAPAQEVALRRAIVQVAALNLAYFFVEFAVARSIGSVSLFADSIDFLEDASVNFLVLAALGWSARRRAAVGFVLALLLLIPGIATAWMAWQKFNVPLPPAELPLSAGGAGRARRQPVLRLSAGARAQCGRQPVARRVSVGAQ